MSRIAVKVKSMMKRMSQAGRDHWSGDQIMVPNLVTRSRKMWLRIPAAQNPQSARNEGESHLRQRQIRSVMAAKSNAHRGRQRSEWVMLRCQVTMSSGSWEKYSRRTSESGKIAASITDQVMTRRLFTGMGGKTSPPRKTAFAM